MEHNGYIIKVSIWPDAFGGTYHAEYSVYSAGKIVLKGIGSGGFVDIGDAEREGHKAARLRIEQTLDLEQPAKIQDLPMRRSRSER